MLRRMFSIFLLVFLYSSLLNGSLLFSNLCSSEVGLDIREIVFPESENGREFNLEGIELLDRTQLPKHLAIIMDGNRRWAKERGFSPFEGHARGAKTLSYLLKFLSEVDLGIKTLTLYAFSTENWKRSSKEIEALMSILSQYLDELLPKFQEYSVRLETIGDLSRLPYLLQKKIQYVKQVTASCNNFTLVLALNYGGRDEIRRAFFQMAEDLESGVLNKEAISISLIDQYLDTSFVGDPDLIIRTGGDQRVSNFLLWQMAYSELYFSDVMWPDFSERQLIEILLDYQKRERRFGGK